MKKSSLASGVITLLLLFSQPRFLSAQCVNADFSSGTLAGWTGTWGFGTPCITQPIPNPYQNAGFNQGVNNSAPNSPPQKCHFIMTGGVDPILQAWGYNLPVVWNGNPYTARIGNTHADGDGESISYSFLVTANNSNFTYHYATVIQQATDLTHITAGSQPYFNIKMVDGSNNPITCADYEVDGSTAPTIGGFTNIPGSTTGGDPVLFKPWTSVLIPLNAYIGQTVKITFTTRSCFPCILGICCGGSHYSYAYISAECAPLQIVSSSPALCGGSTLTLTAPAGAATYLWTGPGVVPPGNTQVITVNQPGAYHVAMTTSGVTPCPFSLDTVVVANPGNPAANFSAPAACSGNATTFTDLSTPAGSITSWTWDFNNDGITDTTAQNPTHTFAAAGTYPVKLSISWPPCTADTTINVVVSPSPTSTFTATSPVCSGVNSVITYTGNAPVGATYTWNFAGGTIVSGSGQGPYQVNWSTGGTKNITLSVTQGLCTSAVTTVPVVVNLTPTVTVSPDASICTGGNTVLTAGGATTYTWASALGLSATNTNPVTANPVATTTYSVTGTTTGCSDSASVTVTVSGVPTSTFNTTSPVCAGVNSAVTYTGNAPLGATYAWNFAGGTVVSGSGQGPYQMNWSTAGTKNITLTVTVGTCVSPLTTVPVVINAVPAVTVSPDVSICAGGNTTLSAGGASNYNWAPAAGLNSTLMMSVIASPVSTTTYSVTGTIAGCSDSASVTVTVHQVPTSAFTASSPVCAGVNSAISYTGNASSNAAYTWNFDGGTIASGSGQGPYQVNWAGGTGSLKNITLSVVDSGCSSTPTTVNMVVNTTPTSTFTTSSPVCTGQNSNIAYTGTGTVAAIYTWGFDGGTIASGAGQGPYMVNWTTAGTKNITLSVDENGCSSNNSFSVVVNTIPTSSFTVVSPVCVGQNSTIPYTGNASTSATYTWGFDGGTIASGSGQGPYQVNWATGGTGAVKNITLTVNENGCTSPPAAMTVTVNDIPVSGAGSDVSFCSGDSAVIGTASTPGYTYVWSPSGGLSSSAISNPTADLTNTTNAIITTNYIVTTNNNGCFSTDSVLVTVTPTPVANFSSPAGQCLTGNNFNFQAGGTFIPSATFAWSFGANAAPLNSSSQNQIVTYSAPGSSNVTLTITQNGCVSNTYTDLANVYPMPVVNFTADTLVGCENLAVCFTDNSVSTNPSTYLWNFGDGGTSFLQNDCHTYVAPGTYSVSFRVTSADGCNGNNSIANMITVVANPVAGFTTGGNTTYFTGTTINLQNQSQNAVSYFWTLGNFVTSTVVNPAISYAAPGTYTVTLDAYNQFGCVDSTQLTVTVYEPESFFIPNVFTPNGDGNNDFFSVQTKGNVVVWLFQIFDRWGEKIHDNIYPWDGNYKGKPSPPGVYVYVVKLGLTGNDQSFIRKGSVTLIR